MEDDLTVAKLARQLRVILASIDNGDLDASATVRKRIEGAVAALETLAQS